MRNIHEQAVGRIDGVPNWSSRASGLTRVLGGILFFALLHKPVQASQSVTLAWDQNTDPVVAGYNMYYGVASHIYTNKIDVGNATSVRIPGLVEGTTYFFSVTAYSVPGLESGFADALSYTVPGAFPKVQIVATEGQFFLTVTGLTGHSYDIEATEDFTTWTIVSTITLGASGSSDTTDPNAASFSRRYYRTREHPAMMSEGSSPGSDGAPISRQQMYRKAWSGSQIAQTAPRVSDENKRKIKQ